MTRYREVFAVTDNSSDPGYIFYTIRSEDTGKSIIRTTGGTIHLGFPVMPDDVGSRAYRVPNNAKDYWFWQLEQPEQRDKRINRSVKGR